MSTSCLGSPDARTITLPPPPQTHAGYRYRATRLHHNPTRADPDLILSTGTICHTSATPALRRCTHQRGDIALPKSGAQQQPPHASTPRSRHFPAAQLSTLEASCRPSMPRPGCLIVESCGKLDITREKLGDAVLDLACPQHSARDTMSAPCSETGTRRAKRSSAAPQAFCEITRCQTYPQ